MELSFDQLQTFLAVVQAGTFTEAANQLGRTQSSVSYAVATLEKAVGVKLFDRKTRPPRLTPAGEFLVREAEGLKRQVADIVEAAQQLVAEPEPVLSLAVDALFPPRRLAVALYEATEAGDVPLDLHMLEPQRVLDAVKEGRSRYGLVRAPEKLPRGLRHVHLFTEEAVAVVGTMHPLADVEGLRDEELRLHPQVVLGTSNDYIAVAAVPELGASLVRAPTHEAARCLIREGLGWGVLPMSVIQRELLSGGLYELVVDGWPDSFSTEFWCVRKSSTPATGRLTDLVHLLTGT